MKAAPKSTMAKVKRDAWSLFLVVVVPLSLTVAIIYTFGSSRWYVNAAKPVWFPSLLAIHAATVGSTLVMGIAGWLVAIEGGFRVDSEALPLYIAQTSLGLIWEPLVLRIGSAWLGLVFSSVHFGTVYGCYFVFGKVNPESKVFVTPCLVWVGYLTLVTLELVHR